MAFSPKNYEKALHVPHVYLSHASYAHCQYFCVESFVGIELKYDFRFWLVGDLFLIFHTLTIEKTNLDSLMSTLISYFSHVCSALTNNHFSCLNIYIAFI